MKRRNLLEKRKNMKRRVLCFGDSNTFGFNAKTGDRFDEQVRWTRKLGKKLGQEYEIIEEGLGGRTAVCEDPFKEGMCGLTYLYPCLMSHTPLDLVIIMLGTNDSKERFSLTPYNVAMGIMRLSEKVKSSMAGREGMDPPVLIVSPPPIGERYIEKPAYLATGRDCDVKTKEMVPYLKTMAEGAGYYFLEAGLTISMGDEDYIHLDEVGHEMMATLLEMKIKEILEKE